LEGPRHSTRRPKMAEGIEMHQLIIATVGLLALTAPATVAAHGLGAAAEVEHARMNALAGGPTNEYDAWLLERYGCYSGTRSAFCQRLAHPQRSYHARRRVYQH
jgi:hypothetical protein